MSTQDHPTPRPSVRVVGVDARGEQVAAFPLGHGADPVRVLRELGWVAEGVRGIDTVADPEHELTLRYAVRPAAAHDEPLADLVVPTDPGTRARRGGGRPPLPARGGLRPGQQHPRGAADPAVGVDERGWALDAAGGGIDPASRRWRPCTARSGRRAARTSRTSGSSTSTPSTGSAGRPADGWRTSTRCASSSPPSVRADRPGGSRHRGSTAAVRWVEPADIGRYRLTRSFAPHVAGWLRD